MAEEKQYYDGKYDGKSLYAWGEANVYDFANACVFEEAVILIGHEAVVSIRKSDGLIEKGYHR